jgi:hypothetical protein
VTGPGLVARHLRLAAKHVDGLVKLVVGVRGGPGEMRRNEDLHGGEPLGLAVLPSQYVHRLASVGETRSFAPAGKKAHGVISVVPCP